MFLGFILGVAVGSIGVLYLELREEEQWAEKNGYILATL
jgi:hypothetical protein